MWVHKPKILKKRFAGNNLSCSSCHTNGGSVQNQSGFVGIWARFPQYNARGDKVITLADRGSMAVLNALRMAKECLVIHLK